MTASGTAQESTSEQNGVLRRPSKSQKPYTHQDEMILPQIADISVSNIASILATTSRASNMGGETDSNLFSQWSNPTDISTILMVIGGDVVQKALAQGTGVWYFTPVCFSFGCVSYAFTALVNIIGNGRLLPEPDYPVKVFNLESGYVRENKNWVVGRILRDLETSLSEEEPLADDAIRISVYEAAVNRNGLTHFSLSHMHLWGLACILVQLGLATIPIALAREWDIMLITAAGTLLVQMVGAVPQWRAEKLPNRQRRSAPYALTQGNGSREIAVIFGKSNCLDLEELSSSSSPRGGRPWEKFTWGDIFSKPRKGKGGLPEIPRRDTQLRKARVGHGLPFGFWLTRVSVVSQSVLWLLLLVNVASSRSHNWVLLAIGALGMFQNGYLAGMVRPPHLRNLPLTRVEVIRAKKVMDGLMDLEVQYGCAEPLRDEFFPGKLRDAENEWWRGNKVPYDNDRAKAEWRGTPRSYQKRISTLSGSSIKYTGQGHASVRTEGRERYSYHSYTPSVTSRGGVPPAPVSWPQEKRTERGPPMADYQYRGLSPKPLRAATPVSPADRRLEDSKHKKEPDNIPEVEEKRTWNDHERDLDMKWRDSITRLPSDDM